MMSLLLMSQAGRDKMPKIDFRHFAERRHCYVLKGKIRNIGKAVSEIPFILIYFPEYSFWAICFQALHQNCAP
jgi:hypothetical protein